MLCLYFSSPLTISVFVVCWYVCVCVIHMFHIWWYSFPLLFSFSFVVFDLLRSVYVLWCVDFDSIFEIYESLIYFLFQTFKLILFLAIVSHPILSFVFSFHFACYVSCLRYIRIVYFCMKIVFELLLFSVGDAPSLEKQVTLLAS